MPRKMSGNEISTMDWLMKTMRVPKVTVASATQRYPDWPRAGSAGRADPLAVLRVAVLTAEV